MKPPLHLAEIIEAFKSAGRMGSERDEPEGSRYVQISDTAMGRIIEVLEQHLTGSESAATIGLVPRESKAQIQEDCGSDA